MALTMKIKLLRVLSVIQCWIALWLIVLGIVERARIQWWLSGLGMPIWTGVWVAITGSFGVFITFKCLQKMTNYEFIIPQHLVMTFMGFSLTCGMLSSFILYSNAAELSIAGGESFAYHSGTKEGYKPVNAPVIFSSKHKEELAVVGSIYAFTVVELILAMWSVALCFIKDRQAPITCNDSVIPLMSPGGQRQDSSGAAILS
ncbi:uncharacterized protein LOC144665387 isoform X2 [Oculina patagonica]